MDNSAFPDYVEKFVESLKGFLAGFDVELRDCTPEPAPPQEGRVYELWQHKPETLLVIHRTLASVDQEVGEYRARVTMTLPSELGLAAAGLEGYMNGFASLGALVVNEERASVICQSPIREASYQTMAGIMATAMVHAARSILEGFQARLGAQASDALHALSAWSDLDFEQVHYDHAHLPSATIVRRGWLRPFVDGSQLTLEAVDDNPYWGGGLLITLRPNLDLVNEHKISINELNFATWLADGAPVFGAWSELEGHLWFVSFAPNFLKELPGFLDYMIDAATTRNLALGNLVSTVLAMRSASETVG
jgi:hypothetical protein